MVSNGEVLLDDENSRLFFLHIALLLEITIKLIVLANMQT